MSTARWGKRDTMIVHEDDPFNAETPPEELDGRSITPVEAFYSRNHGPIPDVDVERWRLRVGGLVERRLELSLADLQHGFAEQTVVATLQCAGNRRRGLSAVRDIPGEHVWGGGAIGTARWTGVALADVLQLSGLGRQAGLAGEHVAFTASDVSPVAQPPQPFGASIPLSKALAGEVLLAWCMDGAPLIPVHGAPVRVVVPGYIGARSVKWLERVTVQDDPSDNYFQATAYRVLPAEADPAEAGPGEGISLGPIALNSEILSPTDGEHLSAGPLRVSGYAFAGSGRSVVRVDVSTDSGTTWQQAALAHQPSRWAWRLWHATVEASAGPLRVVARAWDDTGATQPESPGQLWNPKGYANNSWADVGALVE